MRAASLHYDNHLPVVANSVSVKTLSSPDVHMYQLRNMWAEKIFRRCQAQLPPPPHPHLPIFTYTTGHPITQFAH